LLPRFLMLAIVGPRCDKGVTDLAVDG